jgi:hypothetical protein
VVETQNFTNFFTGVDDQVRFVHVDSIACFFSSMNRT